MVYGQGVVGYCTGEESSSCCVFCQGVSRSIAAAAATRITASVLASAALMRTCHGDPICVPCRRA